MMLTKTAAAVLDVLTADLLPGCSRHVGGTVRKPTTPYMAVCIEALGGSQFSVAHYFVQEGDLCQDPEMVFAKTPEGAWVACYFQQALPPVFTVAHEVDEKGYPTKINPAAARDLGAFAATWMKNITQQQGGDKGTLGGLRAAVAECQRTEAAGERSPSQDDLLDVLDVAILVTDDDGRRDLCTVADVLADNEEDDDVRDALRQAAAGNVATVGGGAGPAYMIRRAPVAVPLPAAEQEAIRAFHEWETETTPTRGGTAGAGFLRPVQLSLAF